MDARDCDCTSVNNHALSLLVFEPMADAPAWVADHRKKHTGEIEQAASAALAVALGSVGGMAAWPARRRPRAHEEQARPTKVDQTPTLTTAAFYPRVATSLRTPDDVSRRGFSVYVAAYLTARSLMCVRPGLQFLVIGFAAARVLEIQVEGQTWEYTFPGVYAERGSAI